jgi:uncharacterized LabA/DUF88 family protein
MRQPRKQKQKERTFVFIDSQNLNLSIRNLGWNLDFKKFFGYLKDTHKADKVLLFLGYIADNDALYDSLEEVGYRLVFKPTLEYKQGEESFIKGNVDAELVLHAMLEYENYDKAIIVTGDGDFYCLIEYLIHKDKLKHVLIPNSKSYSALLNQFLDYSLYVSSLRKKLEKKSRKIKKEGE